MQQAGFSKGFTKIKSRAVAADNQDAMESGFAYSRTGNIKGHFSRYEKKKSFLECRNMYDGIEVDSSFVPFDS